jgi:hypothetical protein
VVLANRGLVPVVAAGVADAGVYILNPGLRFFPVVADLILQLNARWALRKAVSCRLKQLSGAWTVPSLRVAKRAIPRSIGSTAQ